MKTLLVIALLLPLRAEGADGFHLERPELSISFPAVAGEPAASDTPTQMFVIHKWIARTPSAIYVVAYYDVAAPSLTPMQLKVSIASAAGPKATLARDETFTRSGCPALRGFYSYDESFTRIEAAASGKRVYVVQMFAASEGDLTTPQSSAFFDSLSLGDHACPPAAAQSADPGPRDFTIAWPPDLGTPVRSRDAAANVTLETAVAARRIAVVATVPDPEPPNVLYDDGVVRSAMAKRGDQAPDPRLERELKQWAGDVAPIDPPTAFLRNGSTALRAVLPRQGGFTRIELVRGEKKTYVLMYSAASREALAAPEIDAFFASFRPAGATP